MTDFISALRDALSFDIFSNEDAQLAIHSQDSSIFKRLPSGVMYPRTVEDVKTIVKLAAIHGANLSVRAGGTCMSGGSLTNGYILNLTKHLTKISVNSYNKSAEIEMGAFYRDLEKETLKHNLIFPAYTSSKDICGIGGMLGNNASGEKSIRHGSTIDNVHAVDVVLYDGEVYAFEETSDEEFRKICNQSSVLGRVCAALLEVYENYEKSYTAAVGEVKKAASGYRLEKIYNPKTNSWNLAKLFIGAQATTGIVVKARLKLVDISLYKRSVVVPVHDLSQLPSILKIIMNHRPESVETFDKNTFIQAKKFLPDDFLAVEQFFTPTVDLIVFAEFAENNQIDTDTEAHMATEELKILTDHVFYCTDAKLMNSIWNIRRNSFRVMRDAVYDSPYKRAVPCIEDIIVPIGRFDIFIPELMAILKKYSIEYGFHGHIGDGALRIIPIIDFKNSPEALEVIGDLMRDVFELIKRLKGNTSADHGDGLIRTPFLKLFYGDVLYQEVILRIKELFDPHQIFNNDKKVKVTEADWRGWVK